MWIITGSGRLKQNIWRKYYPKKVFPYYSPLLLNIYPLNHYCNAVFAYPFASLYPANYAKLEVTGAAQVHGIEGVEIVAVQYDAQDYYRTGSVNRMERRYTVFREGFWKNSSLY